MINIKLNASSLILMGSSSILSVFVTLIVLNVKSFDSNLGASSMEKRVVKCTLPLAKELDQNLFYVAEDIVSAKEQLFNSKKGLYFEGKMYIKTQDPHGKEYIVPFTKIDCDSVGYEVTQEFYSKI